MPGEAITLGPFTKGLHNSTGTGDYIKDDELFSLVNLEVDTDGSLANRPPIRDYIVSGVSGVSTVLGVYLPDTGKRYLVVSWGAQYVGLVDTDTGTLVVTATCWAACAIQYNNKLYVFSTPVAGASQGGYFDSTPAWTSNTTLPTGDTVVMYQERLWIVPGIGAYSNTSRLKFSAIADPTSWNAADYFDVEPGNGQKLTSLVVLNNDIILFKEHSTFRLGYNSDVKKAAISKISSTIGTPSNSCAVVYNNNSIYLLHDNSVYELYNYTYTKISASIDMKATAAATIRPTERVALTMFRNRLFVRYYDKMYVYSLLSGRWCQWQTTKKFSRVTVLPTPTGETAYAHSALVAPTGGVYIYTFEDDRVTGVQTLEDFSCQIQTKTYDFDTSWGYKVLFYWGITIATSGNTHAEVVVPNAKGNYTWAGLRETFGSWANVKANHIAWSNSDSVIFSKDVSAGKGSFARKYYKLDKKLRFRQAYFRITASVRPNSIADAAVRIYDLTAFVLKKERAVQTVT